MSAAAYCDKIFSRVGERTTTGAGDSFTQGIAVMFNNQQKRKRRKKKESKDIGVHEIRSAFGRTSSTTRTDTSKPDQSTVNRQISEKIEGFPSPPYPQLLHGI